MVPKEWRLEWRQWGGLHVVFNPASGDTHLLNGVSAFVLTSLEKKASTTDEIRNLLSNLRAQPPDDAMPSDIEALVSELDELGLIAPARS
jgi:PqqD family protein of HPr-rel-A system